MGQLGPPLCNHIFSLWCDCDDFAKNAVAIAVAIIEVASVIGLSEASGRVAAGLFITEG